MPSAYTEYINEVHALQIFMNNDPFYTTTQSRYPADSMLHQPVHAARNAGK